jgi:predicted nucleotidyltransferase
LDLGIPIGKISFRLPGIREKCGRRLTCEIIPARVLRMDKSTIIVRLRDHEAELKAAGIEHLSLHGSYARGTAIGGVSDVDIIADFDRAKKLSLIGRAHLENLLTDILGAKADLADRAMLRPEVLDAAQRESVFVF